MRTFGFLVNKTSSLHEPGIPGARLTRVNQSLKRRLDDGLEDVFNRACAANDIEAAADLMAVMEKWHARRAAKYGRERRVDGGALQRVHREMERLCALHNVRLFRPKSEG
ncbi:MAG: hypothetical protein EXR07_13460 [Acetobacteraceae bacterium]|nr:hypothetical protein [Acetobacteraceae bacterium]